MVFCVPTLPSQIGFISLVVEVVGGCGTLSTTVVGGMYKIIEYLLQLTLHSKRVVDVYKI